jgi:hypothetical protein
LPMSHTLPVAHRSPWLTGVYSLGRCFALLMSLLASLIVAAFFEHGPSDEPPLALRVMDGVILIAAVYALSDRRWTLWGALALAVPALVTHIGGSPGGEGDGILELLRAPSGLLFNAFVCVLILAYAVRGGEHVRHRLSGAASGYLLLGFTFASAFALLDTLQGPALMYQGKPATNLSWNELQYFSFATLTTVGYGDFSPLLPLAKTLAVLEAVCGVLFIAMFVSALVGEAVAVRTMKPAS